MPTCKRRNDCFSVLIYPDLSYFVTCNLLFCECPARPDYVNQVLIHQKNENQETVSYSPFRPCENTRRAGNVVWIINSQGTACCSLAFGLSFRQVTDLSSKITLRQITSVKLRQSRCNGLHPKPTSTKRSCRSRQKRMAGSGSRPPRSSARN